MSRRRTQLALLAVALLAAGCSIKTTGVSIESEPKGVWTVEIGPSSAAFNHRAFAKVIGEDVKALVDWFGGLFIPQPAAPAGP